MTQEFTVQLKDYIIAIILGICGLERISKHNYISDHMINDTFYI